MQKIINDINNLKPEYIFLVLGLVFGLLFVYANPPFHSNDEDRHFYLAYDYANGNIEPTVQNNKSGLVLPQNLYVFSAETQGLYNTPDRKVSRKYVETNSKVPLSEDKKIFYEATTLGISPVSYIGPILGISLGQAIDDNPFSILWAGRIGSLLLYIITMFFAIRIIPIHKLAFMLIILSPMALYQATSITHDAPLLIFTFLYIAIVMKYLFSEDKIDWNNIIILFLIAVLIRFVKDGYILIPFVALIIPISKFKQKNIYFTMIFLLFISNYVYDYTWVNYFASIPLPPFKSFQSDFQFGISNPISEFISNPIHYTYILFMNVLVQGKEWIWGVFGRFGYSYTILGKVVITIYALFLFTVALLDINKKYDFTKYQRYFLVIIAVLSSFMIIAGFYFKASPQGAKLVFGLQGRYFLPILPLFILSLSNISVKKAEFLEYKNLIVGLFLVIFLGYTVYFLNTNLWIA